MPNIWVIRPGALGDTILTIPLLYTLRNANPRATITLFGSRAYQEIIPESFSFKSVDDKESLWLFQNVGIEGPELSEKPDAAYVILKNPEPVVLNLKGIGVQNILQASPSPTLDRHLVETLHLRLGLPVPDRYPILRKSQTTTTKNLLWVHPGSGGRKKIVPLNLFAEVSGMIRQRTGWELVITLGEADMDIKSHPQWNLWLEKNHPTVIENRSLKELSVMLGDSRMFVGNDSGISHLAAGLGVKSMLFFTDTDPTQWAPWVPYDQLKIIDYRSNNLPKDYCSEALRIVDSCLQSSS